MRNLLSFRSLVSFLLLLFVFSVPWSRAQSGVSTDSRSTRSEADAGTYSIGKGDVLEVNVWREPMLSGEVVVRNDGMISLALAGDVPAAGRTTMDLKLEIQERLKKYLGEPVVTVILRTPASQKFYMVGEVKTPGEFDLIKEMTVVQAIARAGGFTEWAKKDKLLILRSEGGVEKRISVNYGDIVKGKAIEQNILLRANDTVIVP
jgi:polysaccharide biosynthesis/export protein